MLSEAIRIRSAFSPSSTCRKPAPSSPTSASGESRRSVMKRVFVSWLTIVSMGRTSMDEPASRRSTRNRLMPSVLRATSSARLVRAISRSRSECWTREVKTFWPLTRYPWPSLWAHVVIPDVLLAASGSVAATRLGDSHRLKPRAAGRELRQVSALLRLAAMPQERPHRVHLRVARRCVPTGGVDFFKTDARVDEAWRGPTVFRRDQYRQPAAIRQRPNEFVWIAALSLDTLPVGLRKLRADGAHPIAV